MPAHDPLADADAAPRPSRPTPTAPKRISSATLLAGTREVEIEHHGAIYRLKQTSLGKLILTK